jgi:tetratricopeptide (TPR) repeat protein
MPPEAWCLGAKAWPQYLTAGVLLGRATAHYSGELSPGQWPSTARLFRDRHNSIGLTTRETESSYIGLGNLRQTRKIGSKRSDLRPKRRFPWWGRVLVLEFVVLAAYSNSFRAELVFDSATVIARDARIQAASSENIRRVFQEGYWAVMPSSGLYRPLTTLSYLLNYTLLGDGPRAPGYHWINFALHGVNILLVYALGVLVFGDEGLALALAAIWGLHPLLTDSVTNIVGRADLLAALGVLGGLLCHARATHARGRRKLGWLAGLAAAQAVGIFSKENAVVLPGVMLLWDLTWRERATWRQRAPAYASVALPLTVFFLLRSQLHVHMTIPFNDNPLVGAGFWTARMTAVKVIGKYIGLFIWPAGLSADYSYNCVPAFAWPPASWEDGKALLALAASLGMVLLAIRAGRTWKLLFLFEVFFFITLAPTSNLMLFVGSIMAERFVYVPSIGLAGCLVAGTAWIGRRLTLKRSTALPAATVAICLGCIALGARTYARNFDWHDESSLWSSVVLACPENARAHINLGYILSAIPGRATDTIAEYETAVRIEPGLAEAHYDLGTALLRMPGRMPDAVAEYQAALRIEPRMAEAHYGLGTALAQMPGRMEDAVAEWRATLEIQTQHAGAHNNLGNAFTAMGRMAEAITEYQAALRIQPGFAEAHNDLGIVLAQMPGRAKDAIAEFYAAGRADPGYADAHRNLGLALSAIPGRMPEAIAELEAAERIRPDPVVERMIRELQGQ